MRRAALKVEDAVNRRGPIDPVGRTAGTSHSMGEPLPGRLPTAALLAPAPAAGYRFTRPHCDIVRRSSP